MPAETVRIQRVEVYLQDLKERLQQLRHKHDEVIQNSVDIIKEIDQVSSTLLLPTGSDGNSQNNGEENKPKIKKLIKEFETANSKHVNGSVKPQVIIEGSVNIQEILKNFEQLNDSHVLKDSLLFFRKAKESLEKIDNFFGKLDNLIKTNNSPNNNVIITNSELNENQIKMNKVRDKIQLFNQTNSIRKNDSNDSQMSTNIMINELIVEQQIDDNKLCDDTNSNYTSCCSSLMSLDRSAHRKDATLQDGKCSKDSIATETGYEGDNDDSEYDLLAKRKKHPHLS